MIEISSDKLRVRVHAPVPPQLYNEILTPEALRFIGKLCDKFDDRRRELLEARSRRSAQYNAGEKPHFLPPSEATTSDWKCAPVPSDVEDRRVEITGPVDRKMVINGLNSSANVYMADFEDSTSPTWDNVTQGQRNLRDACRGPSALTHTDARTGKHYRLKDADTAVLFVRPRGWHLDEAHVTVNGKVASASLFDFGLFFFHNAHLLLRAGSRPYFYLPKLESHLEARLWNDVFDAAQDYLRISRGTIRATVLLETITAAFEMEEILYELRTHSLGLNCGRWDYLFSFVKKFRAHPDMIVPDRSFLTMQTPLMEAYVSRLINVCHKRGTFAMGGMSAAIPIKDDPVANEEAMNKVKDDKVREVTVGHDGTWVAHPALVSIAKEVFDNHLPKGVANQIDAKDAPEGAKVTESDLLQLPQVPPERAATSDHLRKGVGIVMAYTEAWLRGVGCIPLHHQMEDAATAEISRAQLWQWRHHGVVTKDDGIPVTSERLSELIRDEVNRHRRPLAEVSRPQNRRSSLSEDKWNLAGKLVEEMLNKEDMDEFLTTVCYPHLVTAELEEADENSKAKSNQ